MIIIFSGVIGKDLDYSKWEMLYQCRSVLSDIVGGDDVHVLLDCARAARRSTEFHPAARFLNQGAQLNLSAQQALELSCERCKVEWASGDKKRALRNLDRYRKQPGLSESRRVWYL